MDAVTHIEMAGLNGRILCYANASDTVMKALERISIGFAPVLPSDFSGMLRHAFNLTVSVLLNNGSLDESVTMTRDETRWKTLSMLFPKDPGVHHTPKFSFAFN